MFALLFAFGLTLNVLNAHPHNLADANAALLSQFTHPVKEVGGPYNQ